MTTLTPDILAQAIKDATSANIAKYVDSINDAADQFGIDSDARMAGFLSQLAIESGFLAHMEENLNYRAASLLAVFPTHFDAALAAQYEHQPQKIANRVYANRFGNGDEASGDGYNYRGRGGFGLTFKDNYKSFGDAVGQDFISNPDLVATPDWCIKVAGWFWQTRNINVHADAFDIKAMTHSVNGGYNDLNDRTRVYQDACAALGVAVGA